jgi:hypothetical protein
MESNTMATGSKATNMETESTVQELMNLHWIMEQRPAQKKNKMSIFISTEFFYCFMFLNYFLMS